MSEYRRYNITLRVADPSAREKFRRLSRPESFFEIRPNRSPGQRGAYSVEMTQDEYEAALEDAANPNVNLIAVELEPPRTPWPATVPGEKATAYVAMQGADSLGLTGSGVTVGQIDSGLSSGSPVYDQVIAAKSFISQDPYDDDTGHGTHMTGLSVPPSAKLALAQTGIGNAGPSDSEAAASAYWLADEIGVDVMLFEMQSVGSAVLQDAVAHALSKNIIVVAPDGNGGQSNAGGPGENIALAPARYPGVLAISNYSTETDALQASSNYGSHTWVAAPGDEVTFYTGSEIGGGTDAFVDDTGGTSAASAIATGVVARFMSGGRSPGNVVTYLADNARPTGASPIYEGNGVLQLEAAEQALQQDKPDKVDLAGNLMEGKDGTGNPDPGACG